MKRVRIERLELRVKGADARTAEDAVRMLMAPRPAGAAPEAGRLSRTLRARIADAVRAHRPKGAPD